MPYSELLTPEQVAQRLHVPTATVLAWLESGEMDGRRFGPLWRVYAPDLRRFLAARSPLPLAAAPTSPSRSSAGSSGQPSRHYTRADVARFLEDDRIDPELARAVRGTSP